MHGYVVDAWWEWRGADGKLRSTDAAYDVYEALDLDEKEGVYHGTPEQVAAAISDSLTHPQTANFMDEEGRKRGEEVVLVIHVSRGPASIPRGADLNRGRQSGKRRRR